MVMNTYSAANIKDAANALPDPVGKILKGTLIAVSPSGRSRIPLTY